MQQYRALQNEPPRASRGGSSGSRNILVSPSVCATACSAAFPIWFSLLKKYIAVHNQNPNPFVWTAQANEILQKIVRANRRPGSKKTKHHTS